MILGHPISTGFHRLTGCQQEPRDRGTTSSAIKLSKNPVMHGLSKHINVHFHFLRELTKASIVELVYCRRKEQLVDVMTKPLKLDVFLKLRASLGVCSETDVN